MTNDTRFFQWVSECCTALGWPKVRGEEMMPENDPSWFFAFDDGLMPKEAAEKYLAVVAESAAETKRQKISQETGNNK